MAKLILNNEDLAEGFFDDSSLIGVMAAIQGYQLCNLLKTSLGLNFRNDPASEIRLRRKKRDYYFAVYRCQEPASQMEHFIYENNFDGEYLLPEFKHLDFAWLIRGSGEQPAYLQGLIAMLKQIHPLQLIVELTNEKIKNKQNLVL